MGATAIRSSTPRDARQGRAVQDSCSSPVLALGGQGRTGDSIRGDSAVLTTFLLAALIGIAALVVLS